MNGQLQIKATIDGKALGSAVNVTETTPTEEFWQDVSDVVKVLLYNHSKTSEAEFPAIEFKFIER